MVSFELFVVIDLMIPSVAFHELEDSYLTVLLSMLIVVISFD